MLARPSAPQTYRYKITQQTGMATQMQLEVVVAGIAWLPTSCEAEAAIKRVNKDENGKRKLFLYPCCLKY